MAAVLFTVTIPAARRSSGSSGAESSRWTRPATPAAAASPSTRARQRFSPGSSGCTFATSRAAGGAWR